MLIGVLLRKRQENREREREKVIEAEVEWNNHKLRSASNLESLGKTEMDFP